MSRVFQRAPSPALHAHVERFWGWEDRGLTALPLLTPGLGAELFFHYGRPFGATLDGRAVELGRAHLVCVRRTPLALRPQRDVGFIAVRVRAGRLPRFTRVPMRELADARVGAHDLWGPAGAELTQRLGEADGFAARVRLLERFLCDRLAETAPDPVAERAVALLYRDHEALAIAALADRCGLGRRQLERRITAACGQSPVELRCLARFYAVARRLALEPAAATLELALEAGYYDQAHFIRELRRFAGMPPEQLRRRTAEATHFYNAPRRAPRSVEA